MNDAHRETLRLSANLIFSLQEHLPNDEYKSYDAQVAQEGLMKLHNTNFAVQDENPRIEELEIEVDDLEQQVRDCEDTIEELNGDVYELEQKVEVLNKKLNERYSQDELLMKYTELKEEAEMLQKHNKQEKERSQKLFNQLAEVETIKKWKSKYVNRNPLCLFCGKSRYSKKRDKYGYCPLLRDCFTCEDCGDKKYARAYNTFNGENISLGEIIVSRHDEDRDEIKNTLELYNDNKVPSFLLTEYPNLTSDVEIAELINEWFMGCIQESNPKEIFKVLSYYRDELSICGDTHL
jgi:hypothetical protein